MVTGFRKQLNLQTKQRGRERRENLRLYIRDYSMEMFFHEISYADDGAWPILAQEPRDIPKKIIRTRRTSVIKDI